MGNKYKSTGIIIVFVLMIVKLIGDEMGKTGSGGEISSSIEGAVNCDDKYLIDINSHDVKLVLVFAQLAYYLPKSLDDVTEMHEIVGTTKDKADFRKDMKMMMQNCKAQADEINSALEKKTGKKVKTKWSEHSMTLEEAKKHFLELFPAYLECKRRAGEGRK